MRRSTFFLITAIIAVLVTGVSAQTPDEIFASFPEINGWEKQDSKEIFDVDNLYNRINGAAPLFIENGFQEMTTFDYTKGEDYITVQVYRHATPEDAFGMYTTERSFDLTFFPIGGEAHGDNESMYFFAGSVYVKIRSSQSNEDIGTALQEMAGAFAKKIAPGTDYPASVRMFPKENKIPHSESYITSNYIGHDFLNKVYVCKYNKDGLDYQLFIINAESKDGAKEILNKYFAFTRQSLEFSEGILLINDRYNGNIPCLWKGQYLIGIFNDNGKDVPDADKILRSLN